MEYFYKDDAWIDDKFNINVGSVNDENFDVWIEVYDTIYTDPKEVYHRLWNPFRLNLDFKYNPIYTVTDEFNDAKYEIHLIHEDFDIFCSCDDKQKLVDFIDVIVHPEQPSKDVYLKEHMRLNKLLKQKQLEVQSIRSDIEYIEKRYTMRGL